MKRIYYAIVCLVLVFALCAFEFIYTKKTAEKALVLLNGAVSSEISGAHSAAIADYDKFSDYWFTISKRFQLLSDHNNLGEIDLSVTSAKEYLKQKMTNEFYVEAAGLKQSIEAFMADECDILSNIL